MTEQQHGYEDEQVGAQQEGPVTESENKPADDDTQSMEAVPPEPEPATGDGDEGVKEDGDASDEPEEETAYADDRPVWNEETHGPIGDRKGYRVV